MRIHPDKSGGRLLGLFGLSVLALAAAACDSRGIPTAPSRPGAERAVPAAGGLAATTPGRQYDNDARAVDETRTAPIGSVVAGRGGQKAQQEAAAKEAADRDARARDIAQREAAQREAAKPPQTAAQPRTVTPAPAPAPITTAAAPPVTAVPEPTPASVAPAPAPQVAVATRPADPNKAFEPPAGWVPPGQSAATPQTAATPAPAPTPAPAQVSVAPPPPSAPAPQVAVAVRPADPNKAFEPPAGWVAPGQPAAAPQTSAATTAPSRSTPAPPMTTAAVAPPQAPMVTPAPAPAPTPTPTPPIRGSDIMTGVPMNSAPPPPMASQRAPERAIPPPAPAPSAAAPAPTVTTSAAQPAPTSTPQPAPAVTQANIAAAQSGAVPSSAVTSPPFGGPMQVAVIQFGRNSAGLSANDVEVLQRVAQIQRRNGGTVRVLGHAQKDVVGSSVAEIKNGNLNLSIKRAESVAQLLIRSGVPSDAIVVEGVSDEEPVYETRTARGIAANRRAEVFIDF